jgi:hypothetical protein
MVPLAFSAMDALREAFSYPCVLCRALDLAVGFSPRRDQLLEALFSN